MIWDRNAKRLATSYEWRSIGALCNDFVLHLRVTTPLSTMSTANLVKNRRWPRTFLPSSGRFLGISMAAIRSPKALKLEAPSCKACLSAFFIAFQFVRD
jgi:hypothetical protein